jgi:hypothetical protein
MNFVSKMFFLFIYALNAHAFEYSSEFALGNEVKIVNFDNKYIKVSGNEIFLNEYRIGQATRIEFSERFSGKNCTLGESKTCGPKSIFYLDPLDLTKKSLNISYYEKNKIITIKISRFPKDFPSIEIKGKSNLKKDFVFSWSPQQDSPSKKNDFSYLFIFSPLGQLKFFRKLPYLVIDFKPHLLKNKLFYSYLKASAYYPYVTVEGKRILFNQNMDFIKEFPELLDFHDFKLLDKNWYMGITYEISRNALGKKFIQQSIVEIKNGKKIYEWSLDDFTKFNPFPDWKLNSIFRGQFALQQYHLNHFQVLGDALLISLGFESVIMINKVKKTIDWVLGGGSDQFGAVGELGSSLHHSPYWNFKTSTLTLFDNGMASQNSRILQYELDLKNKKIKKFSIINTPSVYAKLMGSVNSDGDIYTIGFGTRDVGKTDIVEVQNNKTNMSFYFNYPTSGIYEVYRMNTSFGAL